MNKQELMNGSWFSIIDDLACCPVPDHLTCDLHLHHRLRVSGMEMHAKKWLWILKRQCLGVMLLYCAIHTAFFFPENLYCMQAAANP